MVRSCANIAAGADVAEWEHADLWQQLVDPVRSGRLRARWVPAHKTAAQAQHLPRHSKGLDSTPVCPKRASALPEAYFPPALQALVSALSALTYFPFFASPQKSKAKLTNLR